MVEQQRISWVLSTALALGRNMHTPLPDPHMSRELLGIAHRSPKGLAERTELGRQDGHPEREERYGFASAAQE